MTRGILIAGNESSLLSALATEAANRVEAFTVAIIPNRFPEAGPKVPVPEKAIILPWNPSSPISVRTLIFAAENRMKKIHDAILVCSPPVIDKNADTLTPDDIDVIVNDHIKGWFLLIRELAISLGRNETSSLYLVENACGKNQDTVANLLGQAASASFRAFAQGVLGSSFSESNQVMGFSTSQKDAPEKAASWIFKTIDKGTEKDYGKWHKYSRWF